MPWKTEYNPESGILEQTYSGHVKINDIIECTSDSIQIEKAHPGRNRFLVDLTNAYLDINFSDLHTLVNGQYVEEGADRNGRLVVLEPASETTRKLVSFYETVCINRGWKVKVIKDRNEAIKWLITDTSSANS
jgi:hypothetical protein